ncbi:hypothetical protein J008_01249 [Cryptococcus neoformans]|uniref:Uncharacterized protein n=2 Tax=Cryptococcus neoformans TaxID=5207 RepID=J9VGU8_CRYN9|nr:hypothetical protein CNAG_03873 [Cryptococcus neoformans var. grubii H99]XP_012047516.1 hypothetical protein, variant [Cryptococcus neoformans var. grubii H99]AUB22910.1 hypothetical protein CKF44_03873 [Cryptococcus neoformans var. grubii]OWT41308.1 hypothetical protein C362_00774 [Cryptococcus neoformans var. grubii Bt1]OWZ34770.1 hypothetical protein C347_01335 [Cryptococcus neoformans var. grubii AD2-60a]OWZ46869.1 hypothetical protein C343_01264 [Cryptococcus neoformans var. grubii C23|eukprot:XP_012047515.1 hypothetical protein CNAG_03873 [Cryptococcus neoformans var. grubii H99]
MSNFLNQATEAASNVANTAVNTASNLATQATNLANQAVNSDAATNVASQAKNLGSQATTVAGSLASQAQAQAHDLVPDIVPAPSSTGTSTTSSSGAIGVPAEGEVDRSHDLSPKNEMDKAKFERLYERRGSADELQDKGILKGAPGDVLAGKRADLEKAMNKDVLDQEIAQRPHPEELVQKGILNPSEVPTPQ